MTKVSMSIPNKQDYRTAVTRLANPI